MAGVQVLSWGLGDQQMRLKSMKLENKQLRQRLADDATLWQELQHDLATLNTMPEGKGRRQQVRLKPWHASFMSAAFLTMCQKYLKPSQIECELSIGNIEVGV